MANGSFGLSGLPSAPTTVGSAPNNPFTPVSAVVNSTAGFQAGDLVYNFGTDVSAVPNNYVSTATFPIADNSAISVPNVSLGEQQIPPVTGGYVYKSNANSAKLTNGNIVLVYLGSFSSTNNKPYFKIIDENGTVIVAETQISNTLTSATGNITVGALTGGGFAVGWYNSATTNINYAIYNSSGGTVKAPATDNGVTISAASGYLGVYGRPDGSWILTALSGVNINHKIFSADGLTVIYNWTSVITNQANTYQYQYVVRDDNSFVIFYVNASSSASFKVYSATNTNTVTTSISANSFGTPQGWGGATLLTNGSIVVTWGRNSQVFYAQVSAANAVTGDTNLPGLNLYNYQLGRPLALSNGNYLVVYVPNFTTSQAQLSNIINYVVFNSSNVAVSSYNLIYSSSFGFNYVPTLLETTNALNIIYTPAPGGQNFGNATYPDTQTQINWLKINPSTYAVIPSSSVSTTVGTSAAQSVSGYARGSSTPSGAAFFASTTGSISTTSTQSTTAATLVFPQTVLDTATVILGFDCVTLTNGRVLAAVATSTGSDGTLRLFEFTSTGTLVSTTTIATNVYNTTQLQPYIKLAVLTDGKIACSYVNSSANTTVQIAILSSSYAVLTTVQNPTVVTVNASYGCGLAALTNARFVVTVIDGNPYPKSAVFNSSGGSAIVSGFGPTVSANNICVNGFRNGFIISYNVSGGFQSLIYTEQSTNSWTAGSQNNLSNSSASQVYFRKSITGPSGIIYDYTLASATGLVIYAQAPQSNSGSTINYNLASVANGQTVNGTSSVSMTVTGAGEPVVNSWQNATTLNYYYYTAGYGQQASPTAQTITGLSLPSTPGGLLIRSTGSIGHNIFVLFTNSAGQVTYLVLNPNAYTYSTTLTSGVTPSNVTTLSPSTGVSLIGVSSTDAPANGSGTVVINGPAQLNSSYSASTAGQSFDFGNNVTFGAAGTISGRNVNLIGNV